MGGTFLFTFAHVVVMLSTPPSDTSAVHSSLLSMSMEPSALPGYTELPAKANCLANLARFRGAQPAIRIGMTTQYAVLPVPATSLHLTYRYPC